MTLPKPKLLVGYLAVAIAAVLLYRFYLKRQAPKTIESKPKIPAIELPELDLNKNWKIQPVTDDLAKFHIWNKEHKAPAIVQFNHTTNDWEVSGKDTKTYSIPKSDTQQLRAVIASVLQEVSPLKV